MVSKNTQARMKFEGKVFKSNFYGDVIVTKYVSNKEVQIKFLNTGYEDSVRTGELIRGKVKDYSLPSVCGVGIAGKSKTSRNGVPLYEYALWCGVLRRCYGSDQSIKSPSYEGCTVSDNFKYFPYFKEWCNKQIGFGKYDWHIDKDLLVKGNIVYSEDTCIFLPRELNQVICTLKGKRGDFPIGVSYLPKRGKFRTRLGSTHLGCYETPEEAFCVYKHAKETHIKRLAEKWKDQIDHRAYQALINYQVEITD